MARWQIAAVAAVFFLVVMLATAPARLLAYILPAESVRLQGFEGTLWRGSANSAAVAVAGGHLQLGHVNWQLSPSSLLVLSPRFDLQARWGQQLIEADICISTSGSIRLRDTSITFDATLIRQWLPVQLQGSVNLLTEDLSLQDLLPTAGAGRLVWQRARWIGNETSQDLGDYVLEFSVTEEQAVSGAISTLAGPIEVSGDITLSQDSYSVDARLRSDAGISAEMGNALQLVATPVGDGYQVKLSGAF